MTEDEIADEDTQMDVEEREEPDEDMPNDQGESPPQQSEPEERQESFQAANTISEEEKTLVDKMTKIMEDVDDGSLKDE